MADSVANIKVEIDTDEAQKNLNQLYETQKKLIGEMSQVDEGSEAYNDLAKTLGDTNKQIGGMERNIKSQAVGLNEMDDVAGAASRTVTNLGLAETKLGKVVNTVADTIGNLKNTTDAYKRAQEAANMAVNAGTGALKNMDKVAKKNVIMIALAGALLLATKLVEKINSAKKEGLTLEDQLDSIGKRYERVGGILSKMGVNEIVLLSVEQRRLNEEIELTRTSYANMMNKGEEVTEKMWQDLEALEQKGKDMTVQIKYMNERLADTNDLLEKQAKIDNSLAKNQKEITTKQKELEIEKERNGVTQKSLDLEHEIYELSEKEISLQKEKLDNEKQALDTELKRFKEHINSVEGLTKEEKETSIANKEKEISLQKQTLENQKITLESQKQLNILNRQLEQIRLVKQAAKQYNDYMVNLSEKQAGYRAQNVTDFRQMKDFYKLQGDALKITTGEIQKVLGDMGKKTNSPTSKAFFANFDELLKQMEQINNGTADKALMGMRNKIEKQFKTYQDVFGTYSQGISDLIIRLENNVNTSLQAQQSAGDSLLLLLGAGVKPEDAGYNDQIEQMIENYGAFWEFRKMLNKEREELTKDEEAFLVKYNLGNFFDAIKIMGDAGIQLVDNYINNLDDMRENLYTSLTDVNVGMAQATLEFMSGAIMAGTASLDEYKKTQMDVIDVMQEQERTALFRTFQQLEKKNEERRKAGLEEIDFTEWLNGKLLEINEKYTQKRILANRDVNMLMLQQGVEFVQNMNSVFADLFEENKDVQKASIVIGTLANSALAFGSTFAQAAGGLAAKAAQAAAAAAAVIASGIASYRKVGSANQSTTLEGAGTGAGTGPSVRTGSSSVSSTILERQIRPMNVRSSTDTVLVLSDVEYKQRQQKNVNKITVV